ncbi:MAG: hypothetical protein JNN00_15220 [Chitinophagaceae bacterium]|nr:hypothetical protein [Chitinophagaceae bacterium]
MKYFLFTGMVILITMSMSCFLSEDIGRRNFVFYKEEKKHRLVFALPKGKSEEKYRIGENDAKEQFYYFGDGAVFYVARHTTWPTVNKFRIEALDPKNQKNSSFNGKDSDGLYWKEIQFEEFKVGYAYVNTEKVERFNDALSSVKIR